MEHLEDRVVADGLVVTSRIEGDTATLLLEGGVTEQSVVALRAALERLPGSVSSVTAELRPVGGSAPAMVEVIASASREAGLVVA